MRRIVYVGGLLVILAGSLSAQDRFSILGGFPVGADPVVKIETLPVPVWSIGAEAGLLGPAKLRLAVTYGLGHLIFKTPCSDCETAEPIDPEQFSGRAPISASMDLLVGHQVSSRIWLAAFGGIGMSLAPEGSLNILRDESYRMDTHTSTFATYGADLAVRVLGKVEVMTQVRGATFFIGEQKFMPGTYAEFTADAGTVSGVVLLFGVRVAA